MTYATADDLKNRFGRDVKDLLDRDGDGSDDTGLAEAIIADASAEIDAIIGARYPVPVQDSPWLKAACCDLARYRLYDDQVPDAVSARRTETVNRLRSIAKGNSDLVRSDGSPVDDKMAANQAAGGAISRSPRPRLYDEDGLANYLGRSK